MTRSTRHVTFSKKKSEYIFHTPLSKNVFSKINILPFKELDFSTRLSVHIKPPSLVSSFSRHSLYSVAKLIEFPNESPAFVQQNVASKFRVDRFANDIRRVAKKIGRGWQRWRWRATLNAYRHANGTMQCTDNATRIDLLYTRKNEIHNSCSRIDNYG